MKDGERERVCVCASGSEVIAKKHVSNAGYVADSLTFEV